MARVAFDVAEIVNVAEQLHAAAASTDGNLADTFEVWAGQVAEVMRDEIPVDQGDTRDSVTVEHEGPLTATIGPTNTDEQGRPVGFFVNYGTGRQAPNDFIGRTAAQAGDLVDLDLGAVL